MTPKIEIGVGEIDPPNVIEAKNRFREGPVGRSLLEAIQRISELIGEIPEMPLASRFSESRVTSELAFSGQSVAPRFKGLTEAEYKRESLKVSLEEIQQALMLQYSRLESLAVDMAVSAQEF
jgi:hypothetical protein